MEAQKVTDKILADAREQVQQIEEQAMQKQEMEQQQLEEQLARYEKQTKDLAKKAAQNRKQNLLSAVRMETAKQKLSEKRKILDEVFAEAKRQLQGLGDEQYLNLIMTLMEKGVETGDEQVIVDRNETRIDHQFIKNMNRRLGPGFKGNLRLAKDKQDLQAGFILKRGKVKTNASFDVLIEQARQNLEIELARQLFA
jgi:vacuolar-type H+-ATPase subunit E/Vma4